MRYTSWRRIGIVGTAVVLALPLAAIPPAVASDTAVDVGSTIDLGWASAASSGGVAAVSGIWLVGGAHVDGVDHAFASDLSTNPPAAIDLGTLGGDDMYANDVSGSWAGGSGQVADGNYHGFVANLSGSTPQAPPDLIDLLPAGMVESSVASIDFPWAVGDVEDEQSGWGASWNLTGASLSTVPQPIRLLPLAGDEFAWAELVSGTWVVGTSADVIGEPPEETYIESPVVWSLSGATIAEPVPAVGLPALTGEVATVIGLGGHWAVGSSRAGSGRYVPIVWDLDQVSPSPITLPVTGTGGEAVGVQGDLVVGYEEFSTYTARRPLVWDLSTEPATAQALPTMAGATCEGCQANAIDGDWVVGASRYASSGLRVFAYNLASDGPLLDLGSLSDQATEVSALDGTWVGGRSVTSADIYHPVAWNLLLPARPTLADPIAADGSVSLTWTAPGYTAGAAITGYTVAYRPAGYTDWATTTPTPATATSMTIASLTNGTTYEFKVLATTGNGDSAYSAVKTATTATVPAAPSPPVGVKGKTGIVLTWTDNGTGGAEITDHQVIVYAYAKATKQNPAVYTLVDTLTTGSPSTTFTVPGLTKGKTYVFTVAAGNTVGFGTHSAYSSVVRR